MPRDHELQALGLHGARHLRGAAPDAGHFGSGAGGLLNTADGVGQRRVLVAGARAETERDSQVTEADEQAVDRKRPAVPS